MIQPLRNEADGLLWGQGAGECPRMSRDSEEGQQHDPAQADWLFPSECGLPPLPHNIVMGSVLIHSVQENIRVDDLHFRSANFLRISSSSRSEAMAIALVKSHDAAPIRNVFWRNSGRGAFGLALPSPAAAID